MKTSVLIMSFAATLLLAGCDEAKKPYEPKLDTEYNTEMKSITNGEDLSQYKTAANPTFPIGSKVIIKSEHTQGMKDAKATVVKAYDTIAYSVAYTPADGEPVTDAKWIINEEIIDENDVAFEVGDIVRTKAAHKKGLQGIDLTIASVRPTTAYVVDYVDTDTNKKVSNYQWVLEDELVKQ